MSDIAEAVTEKVLSDSGVIYLIDDRLYPNFIPQDVAFPALAYRVIDTQHVRSHSGSSHLARSTFEMTCIDTTYAGVKALALALRNCWEDVSNIVILETQIFGAIISADVDDYSEQHAAHVVRLDIAIWHSEGVTISQGATT